MATEARVFFGPAGSEVIGEDVLRRPLFADADGVSTGIDIAPFVKEIGFSIEPWQAQACGMAHQSCEDRSGSLGNVQGSTYGGGHISERHTGAESASIGELNEGEQ